LKVHCSQNGRRMASLLRDTYFAYDSKKPHALQRLVTTGDAGSSFTPAPSTLGLPCTQVVT
jgi:hypothetical protein